MKKITLLSFLVATTFFVQAQKNDLVTVETNETEQQHEAEANASDVIDGFSVSGSADGYFRQNINGPQIINANGDEYVQAPATSFANSPGFALGMANIIGEIHRGKVGVTADFVFGPRGEDAVFASNGSSSIINQLYVDWDVSDKTTLTFGNFNTFLGYEVISPTGNFNYSTSYMFSYGPFSHTGVKADFDLGNDFTAMVGVFDPTDSTEFNPTNTYTVGAQLGYSDFFLNVLYGDQDGKLNASNSIQGQASAGSTFQVDLTGGKDVTEKLYLGVNATYNTTATGEYFDGNSLQNIDGDDYGFYGLAGYAQVKTSENFTVGTRIEYFGDYNYVGILDENADGDGDVLDLTLTGDVNIGDLCFKPELRMDLSSEDSYMNQDFNPQSNLASFVLGAVYSF